VIRHILRLVWNRKRENGLVILEISVSFLVVFAVAALALYFWDNYRRPLGFVYEDVWNVALDVKSAGDDSWTPEMTDRIRRLHEALREFPEVLHAGGAMFAPYTLPNSDSDYELNGRMVGYERNEVTDEFGETMGLTLVAGRWFSKEDDGAAREPVVINRHFAEDVFPGQDAVGRDIGPTSDPFGGAYTGRGMRVVGVVTDFRKSGEFSATGNYAFFRRRLDDPSERPPRNILVKLRPGVPAAFEEKLVRRLQAVVPDWSYEVAPLAEMRESNLRLRMVPVIAVAVIGGFLMLMVAFGLMGVLWQSVTRRTREFGLRRAKGASAGDIFRQILGEIALIATLGVAVGLIVVVQFPLLDLVSFVSLRIYVLSAGAAIGLIYVLALSCGFYPAALATRVQPAEALHYE
jgi:putative ABC transport system permease protein